MMFPGGQTCCQSMNMLESILTLLPPAFFSTTVPSIIGSLIVYPGVKPVPSAISMDLRLGGMFGCCFSVRKGACITGPFPSYKNLSVFSL